MTSSERSADQIHATLSQRIVTRALVPGTPLTETGLAGEFGLSRTPVREALQRLATEGLLARGPRRAFVVRRMNVAELADLFETLGEIEATCARLAALRMTEIARTELRRMLDEPCDDYARLNSRFHAAIRDGARNRVLAALAMDLERRSLPWRDASLRRPSGRADQSRREHLAIVDAVNARDCDRAAELMRTHMAGSLEAIARLLSDGGAG